MNYEYVMHMKNLNDCKTISAMDARKNWEGIREFKSGCAEEEMFY